MNELNPWDLSIACIVCIGYISGKLWMYYSIDKEPKNPKSKGVIKRGKEWD